MEKEEFENQLRVAIEHGKNQYQAILDGAYQEYYCIQLNCAELVNPEDDEKIPNNVIHHFFAHLHKNDQNGFSINKKSCLYFFELVSHEAVVVKEVYKRFQEDEVFSYLNKSAMKKNAICPKNILYIGKVKQGIGNRMSTHFGYANPKIGGLQLRYWAKL